MASYNDFEREVIARQQQILTELSSPSPSRPRLYARPRGHQVARLLRSVANRLDPDSSDDLTPLSPR